MARKPKSKNVYERISDKQLEIEQTKNKLQQLANELQELNNEKDNLEMKQLFEYAKENNITLEAIKQQFSKLDKKKSA